MSGRNVNKYQNLKKIKKDQAKKERAEYMKNLRCWCIPVRFPNDKAETEGKA